MKELEKYLVMGKLHEKSLPKINQNIKLAISKSSTNNSPSGHV